MSKKVSVVQVLIFFTLMELLFPYPSMLRLFEFILGISHFFCSFFFSIINSIYHYRTIKIRINLWDLSIVLFGLIYFFETIRANVSFENISLFNQYLMAILLALYIRRRNNSVFKTRTFFLFVFLAILIQALTSIIQSLGFSQFGNLQAYFGEVRKTQLEEIPGLSIRRVEGTLGHPNLVGNLINICLPFLALYIYLVL